MRALMDDINDFRRKDKVRRRVDSVVKVTIYVGLGSGVKRGEDETYAIAWIGTVETNLAHCEHNGLRTIEIHYVVSSSSVKQPCG